MNKMEIFHLQHTVEDIDTEQPAATLLRAPGQQT